ncbi:MAG: hypothetical protein PVF17_13965, partial [Ignavibacteria bacterium]
EENNLSDNVTLVPDLGFNVTATSIIVSSSTIQVDIDPIGSTWEIDPAFEISIQLYSILFLSNPVDNMVKDHSILIPLSASQILSLDTALSFSAGLSNQQSQLFDKYQVHKGFFTILSFDAVGNAVHYSNTFIG